jgi:hypothetical protein
LWSAMRVCGAKVEHADYAQAAPKERQARPLR